MIAASVWHGRKPQINLSCQTKAQAICRVRRTPASRLLKCSLYRVLFAFTAAALAGFATVPALAQAPAVVLVTPTPAWLAPIDAFPLATPASVGGLVIHQRSATLQPFTVAGECGAFVGQGDGSFEAWTWPVKLLSHLRISAHLQHYSVPIDVNDQSSEITVQPDHTTITFAHAAFTVREILFAAPCTQAGSPGVVAMFQVSSIRPVTLTFSFTPELKRMWPAANFNRPDPEWVAQGNTGYYLLHTDSAELAGAVAMPGTQPGILAPSPMTRHATAASTFPCSWPAAPRAPRLPPLHWLHSSAPSAAICSRRMRAPRSTTSTSLIHASPRRPPTRASTRP
jgi:hypothetical protein